VNRRLKKAGAFLLVLLRTIAPYQLLDAIRTLTPLNPQQSEPDPYVEYRLELLRQRYDLDEPMNPLRDAVDRRVFPFGPRW